MLDRTQAVAFMNDFCRPPWTLAAWRCPAGRWIETKPCKNNQEAFDFISKHRGSMLRFLLGYSRVPVTNAPEPGNLLLATGVAMAVGKGYVCTASKLCEPSAMIEGRDHCILVWRYIVPLHAGMARRAIEAFAARFAADNDCRAEPLPLMIPLPGVGFGFDLVFQRKERLIDMLTLDGQQPRLTRSTRIEQDEIFVRGDQAKAGHGLPILKKGWVPSEAITLFLGPPKQGKSLGVAKLSSYITSGGSFEPGGWLAGWWDGLPVLPEARGSVIVCEEEDPRLETLARLKAAGCDMAKVHVRVLVPDISIAAQLRQVTKLAEVIGDCRMISFSPFSSALRLSNYTEEKVREKIRPILKWVRGRRIAIIAIVQLDDGGRTSGSQVIPRVCRSGVKFDGGVMTVTLSNAAPMGVKLPFRVEETTVEIDGTPIETSRILLK
jgi:hypothetical protein